jgi:nickel-dependent lactate racemase
VIVKLPFATDTLAVDLRGLKVRPLEPAAPAGATELPRLIRQALDRPLDGAPLAELAHGRTDATVVVPDATRRIELAAVLPVVLERLARAGVPDRRVSVLVACGTHPPLSDGSLAVKLQIPAGLKENVYRIINSITNGSAEIQEK